VFLLGSCARARTRNAGKVTHIDKCFVTASDMTLSIRQRLGIPSPMADLKVALPLVGHMAVASLKKMATGRYAQDIGYFVSRKLMRKI